MWFTDQLGTAKQPCWQISLNSFIPITSPPDAQRELHSKRYSKAHLMASMFTSPPLLPLKRAAQLMRSFKPTTFGIKSALEGTASSEAQVNLTTLLPPQLTPQRVAEFCGVAGCCWVWEDLHKVSATEKSKIAQVMKDSVPARTAIEQTGRDLAVQSRVRQILFQ